MKIIVLEHDGSNYLEFVNSMPEKVKQLFFEMEDKSLQGFDYKQLANYLNLFNSLGWTFEYYLDAEPYGFRPMTQAEEINFNNVHLFI